MRLSRLYSNRPERFATVVFTRGLNVVFGEIRRPKDPKQDLISFFPPRGSRRRLAAWTPTLSFVSLPRSGAGCRNFSGNRALHPAFTSASWLS